MEKKKVVNKKVGNESKKNKVSKKVTQKKVNTKSTAKKNKSKAFTLIELLAVIIILGVLMIIAIPSVTTYISNSRKSGYVNTAKAIMDGARNIVNEGKLEMYDPTVTYYIPNTCIPTENGQDTPYGELKKAYVGVTFNGKGYDYYWISTDTSEIGVNKLVRYDNLSEENIETSVKSSNIVQTIESTGIDGRSTIIILNDDCISWNDGLVASVRVSGETGEELLTAASLVSQVSEIEDVAEAKRYVGPNPKNYVKFNGDELWRIIGVYGDSIKIVKYESIGNFNYNNRVNDLNPWSTSYIKDYLNNDYYQSLSDTAKSMIKEDAVWYVGAVPDAADAPTVFNSAKLTTWTGKVGLVASYEYLYAARNENNCWNRPGYMDFGSSGCARIDWINDSDYFWTMSPSNSYSYLGLCISTYVYRCSPSSKRNIKPVVYLKSSAYIIGGSGTLTDPYILGL